MSRFEVQDELFVKAVEFYFNSRRAETTRPFIETGQGRYCHRLLIREKERLIKEGQSAGIIVEEQGVKLVYDFRQSPYEKGEQYKGVGFQPTADGKIELLHTHLSPNGVTTDWVPSYGGAFSIRNGAEEVLRAVGVVLRGTGQPAAVNRLLETEMRYAWHHPHSFSDGPVTPKR